MIGRDKAMADSRWAELDLRHLSPCRRSWIECGKTLPFSVWLI